MLFLRSFSILTAHTLFLQELHELKSKPGALVEVEQFQRAIIIQEVEVEVLIPVIPYLLILVNYIILKLEMVEWQDIPEDPHYLSHICSLLFLPKVEIHMLDLIKWEGKEDWLLTELEL